MMLAGGAVDVVPRRLFVVDGACRPNGSSACACVFRRTHITRVNALSHAHPLDPCSSVQVFHGRANVASLCTCNSLSSKVMKTTGPGRPRTALYYTQSDLLVHYPD
jgi:hypothetical protein